MENQNENEKKEKEKTKKGQKKRGRMAAAQECESHGDISIAPTNEMKAMIPNIANNEPFLKYY